MTELPVTAPLPTSEGGVKSNGWKWRDVTAGVPGQCAPRPDIRYLEPVGGLAPWLMGSMLVWAGVPRPDQLSWDWSMDRHADGLSE